MIKITIKANQIDMDVLLISKVGNIQKACLSLKSGFFHYFIGLWISPLRTNMVPKIYRDLSALDRLLEVEALALVDQPMERTSQFVATMKKSGRVRICIDPKLLNEALRRERYQLPVIDKILPEYPKPESSQKLIFHLHFGIYHLMKSPAYLLLSLLHLGDMNG